MSVHGVRNEAGAAGYYDPEKTMTGDHYMLSETTPVYIRNDFVKKVLGIVSIQLMVTFGYMLAVYNIPALFNFYMKHWYINIIFGVIYFICCILIYCARNFIRKPYVGGIMLCIITTCITNMLAPTMAYYSSLELLLGAGITAGLVAAIALFACQTKIDVTSFYSYLLIATLVIIPVGISTMIWHNKTLTIIYSGAGALLVSFFLIFDIQLLLGDRTHEFTVDDYIEASISIYLDIISLFTHIMRLIGEINH
ncbi:Bax inhibitor 1-related [Babesia duncani]|uniref:Bax inhibitor 1-related n=1 Tax=Babesia duncani TaxID=323732 RepID=A0AAD9PML3_9APIC|nr:Bax inhibitor 1-related [Babesia duncani]